MRHVHSGRDTHHTCSTARLASLAIRNWPSGDHATAATRSRHEKRRSTASESASRTTTRKSTAVASSVPPGLHATAPLCWYDSEKSIARAPPPPGGARAAAAAALCGAAGAHTPFPTRARARPRVSRARARARSRTPAPLRPPPPPTGAGARARVSRHAAAGKGAVPQPPSKRIGNRPRARDAAPVPPIARRNPDTDPRPARAAAHPASRSAISPSITRSASLRSAPPG